MKKVNLKDIILFENDNYIIVNKPPYLSALDERDFTAYSLKEIAREYCPEASLCHRLDKETSGALAISKNQEAYRNLAIQFESREVLKVYHAVCEGLHEFTNLDVKLPLYKMSNGLVKVDKLKGKEAHTIVQTVKAYRKHTMVECRPISGRMHQIRVHLASLNASIAGDESYGGEPVYLSSIKKRFNLKQGTEEQPLMKRVSLHAFSLTFKDLNGEVISVIAEYPKDFAVLINQLEKNS
jgi:23S rRNA pseudouridine955/2504/2580 synthase